MLSEKNNTARRVSAMNARHSGLKLVWSRDWKEQPLPIAFEPKRPVWERGALGVAAAAVAGPLVWMGHAALRWMGIL